MELVYLWVSQHKNIKNKGFNFSPRFICDYDDTLKTLTIKKNTHFIDIFFGEYINISAIIGKNGAGKSAIIDQLQAYLGGAFKIYFNGQRFYLSGRSKDDFKKVNSPLQLEYHDVRGSLFDGFSYSTDLLNYHETQYRFFTLMNGNPLRDNNVLSSIVDVKSGNRITPPKKLDIEKLHKWICVKSISLIDQLNELDLDFIPQKVSFKIFRHGFDNSTSMNSLVDDAYLNRKFYLIFLLQRLSICLNDKAEEKFLIELNKGLLDDDSFIAKIEKYLCGIDEELFNKIEGNRCEFLSDIRKVLSFLVKVTNNDVLTYETDINNFNIEIFQKYEDIVIKLSNIDFLNMNLVGKNKEIFSQLSHGERSIYSLNLFLLFKIQQQETKKPFVIFLDEPDLSLHPEWQKNYIYELHRTFNSVCEFFKIKIHFIITSHSPFIVSDIPNQNIIFLDKDKSTGECIVVDALEKKETFGANIHTLLSDSFFMDGLIGKFAQNKIDDLIRFLNDEESTIKNKEKAQELINIIGEPVIKRMLQQKLVTEMNDEIKRENKKLKKEIEDLKNGKN